MKANKSTHIKYCGEDCVLKVSISPAQEKKHTWVFIDTPWSPEEINYNGITRRPPYDGYVKGDETDKEWKRYNKAELALQKQAIELAVKENILPAGDAEGLKFSRRGYCSCGCSRGWTKRDYSYRTIWITIESPKKEKATKEWLAKYRSEQELKTLNSMVI